MNKPVPPDELMHLPRRGVGASPLPDALILGMPHLSMGGLSETWLLKECGHRHWFLLAEAAGRPLPDFRDAGGQPVYAAFVAVSLRDATLDTVREHDELMFLSRLSRSARTQFTSSHRLFVSGRPIGEIVMTSTFVKRLLAGGNHAIARIDVPSLRNAALDPGAAAVLTELASLRSDAWDMHLGFARREAAVIDQFIIDPCPGQDFNGADFLYFANYQAFVDRAEWSHLRPAAPFPTTRRRDIVYRGNVDPGERVVANLVQVRPGAGRLDHWYRLERQQDGATIADIFTLRMRPNSAAP